MVHPSSSLAQNPIKGAEVGVVVHPRVLGGSDSVFLALFLTASDFFLCQKY